MSFYKISNFTEIFLINYWCFSKKLSIIETLFFLSDYTCGNKITIEIISYYCGLCCWDDAFFCDFRFFKINPYLSGPFSWTIEYFGFEVAIQENWKRQPRSYWVEVVREKEFKSDSYYLLILKEYINSSLHCGFYLLGDDFSKCW